MEGNEGNVGKIWECLGAVGSEKAPDAGCTEGWVELLKHVSYANCNALMRLLISLTA